MPAMPRQLILCCDGTNNNLTARRKDTNVAQLCELLAPEDLNQLLYYDPGVGNPGALPDATPWEEFKQNCQRLSGLAFGSGVFENIAQAYLFLMRNWRVGDQIFVYGFSRGAFTARSLGGLVTQFGILRPDMDVMLPTLLHVYFLNRERHEDSYRLLRMQISELFASDAARVADMHFVGVWDTVASVGAPFLSKEITATPTIVGKRFHHVRQALALDEYRTTFKPRPYVIQKGYDYAAHDQSIRQEWFAGSHCDVGGGYGNADAGLSQQALLWMVNESVAAPCNLRVRPELLAATDGVNAGVDDQKLRDFLDQRADNTTARKKLVHSETYVTPWWALGGMTVRNPFDVPGLAMASEEPPLQSPKVALNSLSFPKDTQWQQARAIGPLLLAALLGFLLWVVMGALLMGPALLPESHGWNHLMAALGSLPDIRDANDSFAKWQLGWVVAWQAQGISLEHFHSPRAAVLVDFLFIAAYGYLLARATGWAFARLAGLRLVLSKPLPLLNLLGLAPCVTVVGDVAENLFTLAVLIVSPNAFMPWFDWLLGVGMSLASLAKWAGLGLSVALVAWGLASSKSVGKDSPP